MFWAVSRIKTLIPKGGHVAYVKRKNKKIVRGKKTEIEQCGSKQRKNPLSIIRFRLRLTRWLMRL